MIEKIVSGGQTGVDQAALKIAVEFGLPVGGWCPLGGLDENGMNILDIYPSLTEATTSVPDERTKLNVRDSDGTLIVVPDWFTPEKITDGTNLTIEEAKDIGRHHLVIKLGQQNLAEEILNWCEQKNIHTLNIGGPRESSCPGIHVESCKLFGELFEMLKPRLQFSKM